MKNKKQIVIATSVLVVITILLLGLTYAYYKTRINGNTKDKSIIVTSKKLEITYADGNGVISPTEKIEPGYTVTKTFTVENTGDQTLSYSIKLDNITNTFTRTEDWTYVLKKGDVEVSSGVLPTNETYIINTVSIDSKVTDSYSLTVTYANLTDVDQSLDMGKELSLRVNIDEAKITWNSAPEGTLLYAIKNDNTVIKPLTIPGAESSSETEAVLSSTEDDYGDSFYFRGNVKNNYLNFSGMCWRVVRVQGDGGIKITLADKDYECNSSNYNPLYGDNNAFIGSIPYKTTSTKTSDNLKYETSDIKILLDAWLNGQSYSVSDQTGTFEKKIDDTKLAVTEWCNDMSILKKIYIVCVDGTCDSTDDPLEATETNHVYGASNRIFTAKTPTLKCDMTGVDGSEALKVNSKIGTLTLDEVVFAGASGDTNINYYYLRESAAPGYWTMTPYYFFGYGRFDVNIVSLGGVVDNSMGSESLNVRPALVLKSNVKVTKGDGTQSNPYIID